MPLEFDVYWSFRSPYSYLATPRLVQLEQEYDVEVNVKPVTSGVVGSQPPHETTPSRQRSLSLVRHRPPS